MIDNLDIEQLTETFATVNPEALTFEEGDHDHDHDHEEEPL